MSRKDLGGKLEFKKEVDKQDEYIIDTGKKKLKLSNEEDDAIDGNLVFDDLKNSIPRETNNDQIPENVFD